MVASLSFECCVMQLLPCGHRMCESCYQTHYNRGMKRLQCVWCRKAFAASGINAAVVCPAGKPQHVRQDDPKYAMVSTVDISSPCSEDLHPCDGDSWATQRWHGQPYTWHATATFLPQALHLRWLRARVCMVGALWQASQDNPLIAALSGAASEVLQHQQCC